jgi:hypothetical protein
MIAETLLALSMLQATPPVKNPTALGFICPDHDLDDEHEIDIIRVSDGAVVQTLLAGDPPVVNGEVVVRLNVQPVAFGTYVFVVRAVGGGTKSPDSNRSDVWERVPGRPTGVTVK